MTASSTYEGWAIVELMGHRRRAGLIAEVEFCGAKLLRLDIPVGSGGESVTEFYGGGAIYCLRPCDEHVARAAAQSIGDPRPVAPNHFRLPAPADDEDDHVHEAELSGAPDDPEEVFG